MKLRQVWIALSITGALLAQRQMEPLDRGLIAMRRNATEVYVGWRLLGTDAPETLFHLYRRTGAKTERLNIHPLATTTDFVDRTATLDQDLSYFVRPIVKGIELAASRPFRLAANTPIGQYLTVPLQPPPDGKTPDGKTYSYTANDASVGDLDGDGQYEIVLKWEPSNAQDNSRAAYTGRVIFDAYKLDGTRLWRIDLGPNIRAGAHYTQFLVYDLDGDGRAEIAMKTADGAVDGRGKTLGDAKADWVSNDPKTLGKIITGPERLTIFDGKSGAELATTDYVPGRGDLCAWGGVGGNCGNDCTANRADRFLGAIAYLDGKRPSLVMARGYYGRTVLAAWDWRDGKLTQRWVFDSAQPEWATYSGQGNHNLSVADVDGDGRDEIIYGSMVVDDDGKGLFSTGLRHGDALHVSDLDPSRPGLEVYGIHENEDARCIQGPGTALYDARSGKVIWQTEPGKDVGRGLAADIDPRHPGAEFWGGSEGLHNVKGERIGAAPRSVNFAIWWDDDLLRELLDGNAIQKWDWETGALKPLLRCEECAANNGSKATPALSADLFGDWREEVIWRTRDNQSLRIYSTTIPARNRFITLMHDPQYRLAVAWQNVGYNQPPHPSFYLGQGMKPPPATSIATGKIANKIALAPGQKLFETDAEEGNYRVHLEIGDANRACVTTVMAESRRLMIEKLKTAKGEFVERDFIVNIRYAGSVRLKDREKPALHWDRKLSLEFRGDACPTVLSLEKVDVPTIFLAGDSTVTDQTAEPFASWGQMLTRFLGPEVAVANHAESGESLKSFLAEQRLEKILGLIRPGDYLFIQFGHNDMKPASTGVYVDAFGTYKAYLRVLVAEARRHGAYPVLVTPMHRRNFDASGKIQNTLGDYPEAVRQLAAEEKLPLIDLHRGSAILYESLGPEKSPKAFAMDGKDLTHHNNYGAYELARLVIEGIRAGIPELAAAILTDVPRFDPAKPDPLPTDLATLFIVGDSTANNVNHRGWGDPLVSYFEADRLRILNRARAGRSSRTFITEGLWAATLAEVKTGDLVLIQFGHNDGGPPDKDRARGSLPGIGEEAREFVLPNGQTELVHTFGWYLRKMVADVQSKGAQPVLLSLTVRNIWRDGRVERGSGHFGNWTAQVAQAVGVPFLDLTNRIANDYERLGQDAVKVEFPEDYAHTSPEGADRNAGHVISVLKGWKDFPFRAALAEKGNAIAAPVPGAELPTPRYPMPLPARRDLPTIFLIGDSTVRNGRADGANGQWGWGEPFTQLFDASKVNVVNRALGGLSSRTYFTLGHWDRVYAMLKPGDLVLMQFGHNDSGSPADPKRARASLPGAGDETKEIANPITGRAELVHSYGWYLERFIAEAKSKGATPIVVSPVPRNRWKKGEWLANGIDYRDWAEQTARRKNALFLDLNGAVSEVYRQRGEDEVKGLFHGDDTHTSLSGAKINAGLLLDRLKILQDLRIAGYLP